jgi:hypothetical protein
MKIVMREAPMGLPLFLGWGGWRGARVSGGVEYTEGTE